MRSMLTNMVTNIGSERWFKRESLPWLHGLLQLILGEFFYKLGYASGSEIDLRINPNWQPRPDVVAALEIEQPYPTKPVDVVAEVLSDDPMTKVFEKCRNYARIGIPQILVCLIRNQEQRGNGIEKLKI